MVHIKRVELSHFKSFGGTTSVPLMPGFTVISGPNGSGKSNILDALLFCLGLATSKGMRAERLPDLVNNSHNHQRNVTETNVSVTFDLSDFLTPDETVLTPEWTVSRRLRVAKTGSYTSTFYINSQPCNASELHEHLSRLHIYPEGYNVVLQGDVTRIITMNSKERREIIDELAGVAEFDRKIEKTRETLEEVREREERCQIIAQELVRALERLTGDRLKAEKYQKLKLQISEKQKLATILQRYGLEQQLQNLESQIVSARNQEVNLSQEIAKASSELETLNLQVKALGEEEQLSVASQQATQQAKRQQLQQRQLELANFHLGQETRKQQLETEIQQHSQTLGQLQQRQNQLETLTLPEFTREWEKAKAQLQKSREQSQVLAASSEAWVLEQTQLSRTIAQIQAQLNPQRSEKAQLTERTQRLKLSLSEQIPQQETTQEELNSQENQALILSQEVQDFQETLKNLTQQLTLSEQAKLIHQDTQKRLLKEQRDKQRELDKLEATHQAQQEAQGSYATQVILSSDLPGVCGLVAQLAEVENDYQLALEIAAGSRLGQVVVEDDSIAAAGIALLKQRRVGRATFLPLNKINPPRPQDVHSLRSVRGFIDLAVNLITCAPRYQKIFNYVFGNTLVFEDIDGARFHLGKYRMVTLGGDLLESSGAMTGGSQPTRSNIRFGNINPKDSQEITEIKHRLADIDQVLLRNEVLLGERVIQVQNFTQELNEAKQTAREKQIQLEQLQRDINRLTAQKQSLTQHIAQQQLELTTSQSRLEVLVAEMPTLETELELQQEKLRVLEQSQTHSQWQQIQGQIQEQENYLQQQESQLCQAQNQLKEIQVQSQRLEEKIQDNQNQIQDSLAKKEATKQQEMSLKIELENTETKIRETEILLKELSQKLGTTKATRDGKENALKQLQHQHQQTIWQLEKLQTTQREKQEQLATVESIEVPEEIINNLPEDLPSYLEKLQQEIRQSQKRLEAMEPVNMLALEEYEKTQERLGELSDKLQTLEAERTELLVRVENFTTLRCRAFKEAFDVVNENFKSIFATLSDGDGYLQLEDDEDPFQGGLTLVAHPKGKAVQRLSSMSGGEKSLTALSFIFALQRYRPSPFYAFDEVDMFLDGSNVEKLSKMISSAASQAQFIVVSLRRPMIEASQRTIGVTQARGAHTQVLGIKV